MDWKRWGIGALVVALLCAASFGAGRYSKPARVETQAQVTKVADVQATAAVTEHKVEAPARVVTRIVYRPAPEAPPPPGCPACPEVRETTIVEDRGPVVTDKTSTASVVDRSTEERTEHTLTINDQPRLLIGAGLQWNWKNWQPTPAYDFEVGYRFASAFWVRAHGATDGSFGAGLAITF